MNYDLMIYGTGLSSKVLALALSSKGFKILILRDKTADLERSNLVTFLSDGSLNYLSKLFKKDTIFSESENIQEILCEHINNRKKSKLEFKDDDGKNLGRIVPNNVINEILDKEISKHAELISFLDNPGTKPTLYSNAVKVSNKNKEEHVASLLIYSSSKINKDLIGNIEFVGKSLNQQALSISVNVERFKKFVAYQFFTDEGPLALLPIKNNDASIVWSLKNDSGILNLSEKELENNLNNLFSDYVGHIDIKNHRNYKLNFSYAKKLFYKRCVIIGNIAHNIHPIAGQGFNLSIRDISKLASILEKYKKIGLDIGSEQVLEEFSHKRKFDNFAFSFGTLAMENIFSNQNKITRGITGKSFKLLNKVPLMKQFFINKATGK